MAGPRTDDDHSTSPIAAFVAGVVLTCGIGFGVVHDRPELVCPAAADAALCLACPTCPTTGATTTTTTQPAPPYGIDGPAIVNVWLENCADCLPAFAAWRDVRVAGQLPSGAPIYNVVYGSETSTLAAFSERWGVTDHIMFDSGSRFVQPLGIGTFTTVVLGANGDVTARMRPTDPGFSDALASAWRAAAANSAP